MESDGSPAPTLWPVKSSPTMYWPTSTLFDAFTRKSCAMGPISIHWPAPSVTGGCTAGSNSIWLSGAAESTRTNMLSGCVLPPASDVTDAADVTTRSCPSASTGNRLSSRWSQANLSNGTNAQSWPATTLTGLLEVMCVPVRSSAGLPLQ